MDDPAAQSRAVFPVINPNRCEGKADCVAVCPADVFELRALTSQELAALPFFGRLRVLIHGVRQAFPVRAEACLACGKCVSACPERAITLRSRPEGGGSA